MTFFLVRTAPWTLAATWTHQLEPAKQTTNDLPVRRHDAVDRGAPLIELIWSYWHEEGRLVQTMNAIRMRLQNRRGRIDRDPLANLEIDPLRPLNNLLWATSR
jgi:hypothetical protein